MLFSNVAHTLRNLVLYHPKKMTSFLTFSEREVSQPFMAPDPLQNNPRLN